MLQKITKHVLFALYLLCYRALLVNTIAQQGLTRFFLSKTSTPSVRLKAPATLQVTGQIISVTSVKTNVTAAHQYG